MDDARDAMLRYIHQGLLESALALLVENDILLSSCALASPIQNCLHHANIVQDYGFENFEITPKGGAFAHFQTDGTIVLSGTSEAFGRCSREAATQLVQTAFPDRSVYWSETGLLR
jgi:hypothetical protein